MYHLQPINSLADWKLSVLISHSERGENMNKSNEVINALEELTIYLATFYKEHQASEEEIAALAELAKVTLHGRATLTAIENRRSRSATK